MGRFYQKKKECRTCGADIIMLKTKKRDGTEGWIPVDAETVEDPQAEYFDRDTMTSHFATCPEADQHRKKK